MLLGHLLKSVRRNYKSIPINGISFDSRKVNKGDIFLQLKEKKFLEMNILKKLYIEVHQLLLVIKIKIINFQKRLY